jgi:hypothetical protein
MTSFKRGKMELFKIIFLFCFLCVEVCAFTKNKQKIFFSPLCLGLQKNLFLSNDDNNQVTFFHKKFFLSAMDFEDFTFETAPFPPEPLPEGKIFNKTIQAIVQCIVSLPTDPASPFVTLAASLPNPTATSTNNSENNNNNSNNNQDQNNNKTETYFVNPQTGLVSIPGLSDKEVEHAREVLRLYPGFAEVRRRIVPRLVNDEKFWQAYFCLLAIQTRYETRLETVFGSSEDQFGDSNDNNSQQQQHSEHELQSMMSARVVLRMPTPSLQKMNYNNNNSKKKNTNTNTNTTTSISTSENNNSAALEPGSPTTTRIIPGKRSNIPPSLCITIKDSDGSNTNNNATSSSSVGSGGSSSSSRFSFSGFGVRATTTSTMLAGKDLMTKHMRDVWRRNLNEMCDF